MMEIYKLLAITNCGFYTTKDAITNTMVAFEEYHDNRSKFNFYNKDHSFKLVDFGVYGDLTILKNKRWKK